MNTDRPPTLAQGRRAAVLARLVNERVGRAVAAEPTVNRLPSGEAVIVVSTKTGNVAAVEIADELGRPLDDAAAEVLLGQWRAAYLDAADRLLGDVVALAAVRIRAGGEVNLRAIAKAAGCSRSTLYTRLTREHGIDGTGA